MIDQTHIEAKERPRPSARQRAQGALDLLFLILYGVYVCFKASKVTTLSLPWPKVTEDALLIALAAFALARVICLGLKRRDTWIALALAGVCRLAYGVGGYEVLNFLGVVIVGFVGMDHRKALKTHLIAAGGVLVCAVAAALTGSIRNIVYYRDGLRSSWGICYPTDFSTYALFLAVALWVAWDKLPDWAMLLLALVPLSVSLFITKSRNGLMCGALFIALIAYLIFEKRVIDRRRGAGWVKKAVNGLTVAAFPLCAIFAWALVWLYSRDIPPMVRLNDALSDRLQRSVDAVANYGVQVLGTKFTMVGNGFSTIARLNVNFIDSTYVLLPVRYGWLLFACLGALWVWLTVRAIRGGRRRLALALGLIAFHSLMEHHFIELHYNVFLALVFASVAEPALKGKAARARQVDARKVAASAAALVITVGALWWALPKALMRMRTAFDALGWRGGGEKALPVMLVTALGIAALAAGARAAYRLAYAVAARRRPPLRVLPLLMGCFIIAGGGYLWSEKVIGDALVSEAKLLKKERTAMEAVVRAATGGVYVNGQPVVYDRAFGGVSPTVLAGEDLAGYDGATAVMDAAPEYNVFFQTGWRFAQISDAHAVYTSDPAVIDALEAAGYAVTEYYATPTTLDMQSEAKRNHLEYDRHGALLKGTKKCLKKGTRDELFTGIYSVRYKLYLPEKTARAIDETGADALVCTLRITAYKGETVVAEVPVYRSQFDEKRRLTLDFTTVIYSAQNVEFLAFTEEGMRVYVAGISYQKVG